MKKIDFKKFLEIAWPFFGLAFFIFWGWLYVKPMLPEDFISFDKITDKVAGIFKKDEAPVDPDEKYDFYYSQSELKPKTSQELGLSEIFSKKKDKAEAKAVIVRAANSEELVKAAREAKGGEVIELKDGEYKINLIISADLSLIGQGSSTVLRAENENEAIIKISAKEFRLENLVLNGGKIGLEASGGKITVNSVKFSGFSATACWVGESELIFKQSYIYESNSALKTLNSRGEISRSIIKNNKKSGIELRSGNFKIFDNIITNNESYGVFADQYSEVEIAGNFIDKNKGFNVRIEGEGEIYR